MNEKKKLEKDQNQKDQFSSWQWCAVVEEVQVEGRPEDADVAYSGSRGAT